MLFFRLSSWRSLTGALGFVLCLALGSPGSKAHAQAVLVLNNGNTINNLAGNGMDGRTAAGSALLTALGHPRGLVYDEAGNLYMADSRNHQVDRISADGQLTIVAGTGKEGFSGDGGPAAAAQLRQPSALAIAADGTLFIADTGNHRIRSVNPSGTIATIAGGVAAGNTGDGGAATAARLRLPAGLAVDASGNLLIADTGNHRLRSINSAGVITAVAGTGEEGDAGDNGAAALATFLAPSALLSLLDGRILIADSRAHRIRVLQPDGTIAPYTAANLRSPQGLAAGPAGDVLVSDAGLQQLLQASAATTGALAGSGMQGASTAGPANATMLDSPSAVAVTGDGQIALSDSRNHAVQRITLPLMDFGNVPAGQSAAQALSLQNGGDATIQVLRLTLPNGFANGSGGSCGSLPVRLAPRAQCTLTLVFQPQAQGTASGMATVWSDAAPAGMVRVSGTATAPSSLAPSTTAIAASGSISYAGAQAQFTATVAGTLTNAPTGSVTFADGATPLTTVPLTASTATYATATLAAGTHTLHATYSGDSRYATSTSPDATVTVVVTPDFALTASAASYSGTTSTTITVPLTCLPQNGTLNHPVTLTVTGLPTGFTAAFTPAVVTLGGNPASSSLAIRVPATVASLFFRGHATVAAAVLLLPFGLRRRKIRTCAILATATFLAGCGGFRTATNTGSTSGTNGPFHYNLTVTATTTGVLGETLVHSVPVELVITP